MKEIGCHLPLKLAPPLSLHSLIQLKAMVFFLFSLQTMFFSKLTVIQIYFTPAESGK